VCCTVHSVLFLARFRQQCLLEACDNDSNGDNTACKSQRRSVISPAVETDNRWRLAQSHRDTRASRFIHRALLPPLRSEEQKRASMLNGDGHRGHGMAWRLHLQPQELRITKRDGQRPLTSVRVHVLDESRRSLSNVAYRVVCSPSCRSRMSLARYDEFRHS
jgi:hypothetical protein